MKTKATLFALTTLLLSSSAFAADVFSGDKSLKDDKNYASGEIVNWSGFYIGGQVGYGHSNHELSVHQHTPEIVVGDEEADLATTSEEIANINGFGGAGFVGGGRLGYDHAFGRFLVGVYGEYNTSNIENEVSFAGSPFSSGGGEGTYTLEKDNEWSIGVRAGVLVAPRTLTYLLAAYTQSEYSLNGLTEGDREAGWKDGVTMDGVTVGAGVEYAVASNIFVGLEGLYTFYGEETLFDNRELGIGQTETIDTDELKVMGTLKIKLNGFGN
jgi:outer membrane immunogenic protein